jgi:hypothetical protein
MKIPQIIGDAIQILTPDSKPIVTYYHGISGIKEIYQDTLLLPPEEPIYAFLNPEEVHQEIYQWLTTTYINERIKKGIYANVFVTNGHHSPRALKYKEADKEEKRTTFFIESNNQPFECEIDIYGGKTAFINYNPKDTIVGIIINHPTITKSLF